jgi:ribosome-associated heat shock protein Hsp15
MDRLQMKPDERDSEAVRLDKWLWAARFFRTRALAAEAIDGGKVHLNGERAKRSKMVRIGDEITVRLGPFEHRVVVKLASDRRGSASIAATLFDETEQSRLAREALAEQHRIARAAGAEDARKPSKRDRRQIDQLRRRQRD